MMTEAEQLRPLFRRERRSHSFSVLASPPNTAALLGVVISYEPIELLQEFILLLAVSVEFRV